MRKANPPNVLPIGCCDGENGWIVCQCGCIESLKGLLLCSICIWWFAGELKWCHSLTYPNTYPKNNTYHDVTRWHILSLIIITSLINEEIQPDPTYRLLQRWKWMDCMPMWLHWKLNRFVALLHLYLMICRQIHMMSLADIPYHLS